MTEPQALQPHHHPYQFGVGLVLLTLAMPLLWWVSHPSRLIDLRPNLFVFWHTVAELVAVVVAMLIFATGYRAVLSERKGAVVWLGLAFLGVGLLDLLHTMSYVGMPDALTPNTPQKSIFFWLVARTLAAVAMLVYAVLPGVPDVSIWRKRIALGLMLALVAVLAYGGLMHSELLPAFFVAGQGLTPLKIRLEWLIISLNLITLAVLWFRRQTLARECLMALILPWLCLRFQSFSSPNSARSIRTAPTPSGMPTRLQPTSSCFMQPSMRHCADRWNTFRCCTSVKMPR